MEENTGTQQDRPEEIHKKNHRVMKNVILFIIETVLLMLSIAFLYVVIRTTDSVEKIAIDKDNLKINKKVEERREEVPRATGYRNIALFGLDARNGELDKGTRSDTIIIASINQDTREIKLISVYRDTYLNLGNDRYTKCNAAYAAGGPQQALNMLNTNLDLDIADYVSVGFAGLIDAIDALGGVVVDVSEAEISHLNNYQITMADELGVDYTPVTYAGKQRLNGMQATAYCRIRYTKGDDFRRTQRQRDILIAMMEEAKRASIVTLNKVVNAVLPQILTSLDIDEVLFVLNSVAEYNIVTSDGFPYSNMLICYNMGVRNSCIVPQSLEANVIELHKELFGEDDYTPSPEISIYSKQIEEDLKKYSDG